MKLWYNGQVGTDWTFVGVMAAATSWQYMFGGWNDTSATWKQSLDHVVVSNDLLTDAEVLKLASPHIDYHGFIEHIGWEIDAEDWATTHRVSPQALSITNF